MANDWIEHVERHRAAKDEAFASDHRSPIPTNERSAFDGLDYYPVDGRYRFIVPLREHDERTPVTVATTTDGEREYLQWGEFRFEIDDEPATVQAYKADADDGRLWIPFRDATSGVESYGAGRYLDLDPAVHRTGEGDWVLDFNEAYNPTCAYSDRYECPLPPMENWLDVSIEAGEKTYRRRTRSTLTESTETSQ